LSAYSHLFNEQAIREFSELAQTADDIDERAVDNDREALSLESGYDGVEERGL